MYCHVCTGRMLVASGVPHRSNQANARRIEGVPRDPGYINTERSTTYPYPRGLAGPEIVYFGGLNSPLLPQNSLEKMGGFAPHLFQWVLR